MKKSIVTVSDHAVLRYLERVASMDIERIRRSIGRSIDAVMLKGATGVIIDGIRCRIDAGSGVVTTVVAVTRRRAGTGVHRDNEDG